MKITLGQIVKHVLKNKNLTTQNRNHSDLQKKTTKTILKLQDNEKYTLKCFERDYQ